MALAGAWLVACSKAGEATEGPAGAAGVAQGQALHEGEPGEARDSCPDGMVRIPGNETLKPFCMGETEVSVREFRRCVEAGVCRVFDPKWDFLDETKATWLLGDESMPINYVDEEQARQYCEFLGGRLPKAEEWIWALGSAKGWAFPWGNELSYETTSYCGLWRGPGQRYRQTALCPARQYPLDRTLQGVHDMAGSADEIIGPNEKGEYGIPIGIAPSGIPRSEAGTGKWTQEGQPQPWYAGPLVTWNDSTSLRCAMDLYQ